MNIHWLEQVEADVPMENQWLGPAETACLERLRFPKRRADWRLGRWTAKQAVIAYLGLPAGPGALANIEIRAADSGAPEVFLSDQPAPVAISLSHRAGLALCALAPRETTIGCDLETVESRSDAFVDDYFTPDEKTLVARAETQDRPQLVTLLWSAKESTLKALRTGLRLDTTSVSVNLGQFESAGTISDYPFPLQKQLRSRGTNAEEWRPLHARYGGEQVFSGWWRVENQVVRTIVSAIAPS